jgi:hypothetical protein
MPKVKLARRWGSNKAGSTVEVSQSKADFLKGIGWTEDGPVMNADAVAPGTDGPDPIISGDPTRRRISIVKLERDESVNRAEQNERAPKVRRPVAPQVSDGGPVSEGGEDSARGEVSSSHETVKTDTKTQTGRSRKASTPEKS